MYTIALTDDHVLLRKGLAQLIESFGEYKILFEADNGKQFIECLPAYGIPDLVLIDINMPEMNGYETCKWLMQHHPEIKILSLSMLDDETSVIKMLRAGARGYVLKDCHPSELQDAMHSMLTKNFYYSDSIIHTVLDSLRNVTGTSTGDEKNSETKHPNELSKKEIEFIKLSSTELTYKAIAAEMNVSPKTIDNFRNDMFCKLGVRTRIGVVMYGVKNGIVEV